MNRIRYRFLLAAIVFMCAVPATTFAQGLEDGLAFESPDADLPIDGGVSLLLVAGISYGAKKLYDKRNSDAEGDNK